MRNQTCRVWSEGCGLKNSFLHIETVWKRFLLKLLSSGVRLANKNRGVTLSGNLARLPMKPVSLGYPVSNCLPLAQVDSSVFAPVVESK